MRTHTPLPSLFHQPAQPPRKPSVRSAQATENSLDPEAIPIPDGPEGDRFLENALARATAAGWAELLVVALGYAARTHTVDLRACLAGIFDLGALEHLTGLAQTQAREAVEMSWQALDRLREIEERIKEASDRLEALEAGDTIPFKRK